MADLNHYAISAILDSDIVGELEPGHGQIDSLADVQRRFEIARTSPKAFRPMSALGDKSLVVSAFLTVREKRNDRGSSDLYIADPERNNEFIQACRSLGATESVYVLNKTLMSARKAGQLKGLKSQKTSIDYENFAFASEFSATELRFETGASIDDIICDPELSGRFDAAARRLAPGHSFFDYRWALLSIRKSGRDSWKPGYPPPVLQSQVRLVRDPLESVPATQGVYLLFDEKKRPLYARSSSNLRHAVEVHREPAILEAVDQKFWKPNLDEFVLKYSDVSDSRLLRPYETKIVRDQRPLFNVPREAA